MLHGDGTNVASRLYSTDPTEVWTKENIPLECRKMNILPKM